MYTSPLTMLDDDIVLDAADMIPFGVFPTVNTELRVSLNIAVGVLLRFMKVVAIFVEVVGTLVRVVVLVVALRFSVEFVSALLPFDAVITIGRTMAVTMTRLATVTAVINTNLLVGLAGHVKNGMCVFP
jgi:hypothetical protein